MFRQIIERFSRLPEFSRLDLLRRMIEGQLDYASLLKVENLEKLRTQADVLASFDRFLSDSMSIFFHNQKAKDILIEYSALPIGSRINQQDEYHTKLLKVTKKDDPILNKFNAIRESDHSVYFALEILIDVYARDLYLQGTNEQAVRAVHYLHPKRHKTPILLDPGMAITVDTFKKLYNILINSYISDDKKQFLELVTGRLIELELQFRASMIGRIQFLTKLNLSSGNVKEAKFLLPFFGTKTPEGISKLQPILAQLPRELGILEDHNEDKVNLIKRCFAEVKEVVMEEKKKKFGREQHIIRLYADLSAEIDLIEKTEGEELEIKRAVPEKK